MSIFVDTSAFYAVLDADDQNHPVAAEAWMRLISAGEGLICSNYILLETLALLQHRLGLEAVRIFQQDALPVLHVLWVEMGVHQAAMAALLTSGRRDLSLVDCVSFELMRRHGLSVALAFDRHFAEQGFAPIS
jgi:uncharacterized protein